MTPPVAVDFEPHPHDDVPAMFCEEKRRWCHQQGIVYVPIFRAEMLTKELLVERVKIERQALQLGQPIVREDRALKSVAVAPQLDVVDIDREALARLAREVQKNPNLRGATRARRLATLKRAVERDRLRRKGKWGCPQPPFGQPRWAKGRKLTLSPLGIGARPTRVERRLYLVDPPFGHGPQPRLTDVITLRCYNG